MTKEIEEKIEITLDIYNNIVKLIRSSDDEDFFIGLKTWFAMDPPEMLTVILRKQCHEIRSRLFLITQKEEGKWSINHRLTWSVIIDYLIADKEYVKYKDIVEQEFTNYVNQKLLNEGIGKNIKPIKLKIKWQN